MPLSSILFRKKPDAASASKPPQPLMHRAPAVFTNLPLILGLRTIADAPSILGAGDGHHYVKGSSVYFPSSSSACSSSFASSFMSPASPTGSDLGAGVLDRKVDEEDNQSEKGNTDEEDQEEETGEEGGGNEDDERYCWASYGKRGGFRRLPPPISVLAKAGDQKRCLMPWVLRRSYEVGGRLVMREVKVENQEYLKPCRAGGRLTLKLVHLQELPGPSAPSTPAQAKSATAPVPVRASGTPRSRHTEIPTTLAMQSPRTLPRSSSEKVGRTGNPKTAAWRPVCSREDSGVDVLQRRRGALTLAASSLATLSSSLPEASTMGCYANARPDSRFGLMTAARMPPVHS